MRVICGKGIHKTLARRAVVAIGVFDGMHRGHVRVVKETVRRARVANVQAAVVTFSPHPVHVLRPQTYCPLIISLEHRLKILAELGVDICLVIPFRKSFARLSSEQFVKKYLLRKFSPSAIVVGDDFRFGRDRQSGEECFRSLSSKWGFKFLMLKTRIKGQKRFSSTLARKNIVSGNLRAAAAILGRPVALLGRVVRGEAVGRKLGYPTANIHPLNELLPPSGIYLVRVCYRRKEYPGMAYIGRKPSFKSIRPTVVEAHMFHFHQSIYGKEILIKFLKKIRDERTFSSQDELVHQIRKDEQLARRWFSRKA